MEITRHSELESQSQIGLRIKESRKAKGLTQKELGIKLGVSHQAVANWERGDRSPQYDSIVKLAEALGVTVGSLLYAKNENEDNKIVGARLKSAFGDNLRFFRQQKNLKQNDLAELTGISATQIKAYEDIYSNQFVTEDDLEKLSIALGVPSKDLLGSSETYEKIENGMMENLKEEIKLSLENLNLLGLQKACERVSELGELLRYKKKEERQL